MSKIHVKSSVFKQLPAAISTHVTPVLFVEHASMPASSGKSKSCVFVITNAGLYFCRPKMLAQSFYIKQFISIYSIESIEYVDSHKQTIQYKGGETYVICDHLDEAVSLILACRLGLFAGIEDPSPIRTIRFPTPPSVVRLPTETNLTLLTHVCKCIQHNDKILPVLYDFFEHLDAIQYNHVTLGRDLPCPRHIDSLVTPIAFNTRFNRLELRGFIPNIACRVASRALKLSRSISTIIFSEYTELNALQLKLSKLPFSFILSIRLQKCRLPDSFYDDFISQLSAFRGCIQRFSLIETATPSGFLDRLSELRCFRTVEYIEVDGLLPPLNPLVLTSVKASGNEPLDLGTLPLSKGINAERFDASRPSPPRALLSNGIKYLNLKGCRFTTASLRALFSAVGRRTESLYLGLGNIILPSAHWDAFFNSLSAIPPPSCLVGLDWSGNPFPKDSANNSFMFPSNLRYMKLDGTLASSRTTIVRTFFENAKRCSICYLSLQGEGEVRMGEGGVVSLLDGLSTFEHLEFLDISGNGFSDKDAQKIMEFVVAHKTIRGFAMDGTFMSQDVFINLWTLVGKNLKFLGRPIKDIKRLFPGDVPPKDFCSMIRSKDVMPSEFMLSLLKPENLDVFLQTFPLSYRDTGDGMLDPVGLQSKYRTPLQMTESTSASTSLPSIHASVLTSPFQKSIPPEGFGRPRSQQIDLTRLEDSQLYRNALALISNLIIDGEEENELVEATVIETHVDQIIPALSTKGSPFMPPPMSMPPQSLNSRPILPQPLPQAIPSISIAPPVSKTAKPKFYTLSETSIVPLPTDVDVSTLKYGAPFRMREGINLTKMEVSKLPPAPIVDEMSNINSAAPSEYDLQHVSKLSEKSPMKDIVTLCPTKQPDQPSPILFTGESDEDSIPDIPSIILPSDSAYSKANETISYSTEADCEVTIPDMSFLSGNFAIFERKYPEPSIEVSLKRLSMEWQ